MYIISFIFVFLGAFASWLWNHFDHVNYLNVMRSEYNRDLFLWLRYLGERERLREKKQEFIKVDWKREGF